MKGTEKKPDDFNPLHRIAVASGAGMTLLTCIGVGSRLMSMQAVPLMD